MATEETIEIPTVVMLTEEQQQFLTRCESDFSSRYTEKDVDFMAVKDFPSRVPPIVDPWYNKPRRNFDWTDRRGRRGGGGDNDRGYQHYRNQNQGGYQHHRQGERYQQRYRPY